MRRQISKKIFFYFFLFFLLGTFNNKFLNNLYLPNIEKINILGLDKSEKNDFLIEFERFKSNNLLSLDKTLIEEKINSNELIERYSVFKIYPSSLQIDLKKTEFLANIIRNGKTFFVGSNGKIINSNGRSIELPFIFGEYDSKNFFKLKKDIEESLLNYSEIKNLFVFPSGRWDIETKSGILIKLPKKRQKESLNLFSKLIQKDEFNQVKIIDFRQKNQVIVNE